MVWLEALGLLREMDTVGIPPNDISFNSAMDACAKCETGGKGAVAMGLLREMERRGIVPNVISYSCAMLACRRNGMAEEASNIRREMEGRGFAAES